MSWKWTKGANVVTLSDPDSGYEAWEEKAQAVDYTAAGSVRVYDKALSLYRLRVRWSNLSDADKAAMLAFFHNASIGSPAGVNGCAETWTLTDEDNTTYTARFLTPELRFTKDIENRWTCEVEIETSALVTT